MPTCTFLVGKSCHEHLLVKAVAGAQAVHTSHQLPRVWLLALQQFLRCTLSWAKSSQAGRRQRVLAVSFGLFSSDASWCFLLLWIPQGHLHIAQVPQGEQVQITQDSEVSQVSCQGHRAVQSCTQCAEPMPFWQSLGSFLGEAAWCRRVTGMLFWCPLWLMMV